MTARGNAQQDIFRNDEDRQDFLDLLQRVNERYHWYCHAYCLDIKSLSFIDRNVTAYLSDHYTLQTVGEHFGVSYAAVSLALKLLEPNEA